MEGITHGIRQGSPRKVKISVPKDEPKDLSSKALRIQAKYGVVPLSEKKQEKKSEFVLLFSLPFLKQQILDSSKLKVFADDNLKLNKNCNSQNR